MAATAALFGVTLASGAQALDATNTWRGGALITSVTDQCNNPGFPVAGQTLVTVFRPRFVNTDPNSALLLSFSNGALLVTPTSTAIPSPSSGTYTGQLIGGAATFSAYTSSQSTYSFTITPATLQPNTPQITIKGTLKNFRNTAGCTVKFSTSLFRGIQ
jgi:hypothetical protein